MKKLLLLFIGGIICAAALAEVRMSNIFTDHMVLQRGKPVPIWGTAKPGAEIDVVFGDEKRTVRANDDGEWVAVLKAMKANSDPQDLEIYENGHLARKISDVLVGEVWIASGQSNMEWAMRNTTGYEDAKKRAGKEGHPQLRFFYQPIWNISDKPQEFASDQSSWYVCTPDRIDYSTAVGFYFAEQLMKDLDVPVGIIQAAAGGSSMRSWIPQEGLTEVEFLTKDYLEFKKQQAEFDYPAKLAEWEKLAAGYDAAVKTAKAEGKAAPEKPEGYDAKPQLCSPRHVNESPSFHYNSNISHLRDFPVRGVIWYQGESDSWGELLENFIPQLKTLVDSWRKQFNDDVYFYTVQITSWKHGQFWPETVSYTHLRAHET